MFWQFLFFLIVTLIRQFPHLIMEISSKNRRKYLKYSGGKGKTILMYALYIIIWLTALYRVFIEPPEFNLLLIIGAALLVFGVGLRFVSLFTLGKYFASNVALQASHRLIRNGVYNRIRHPIYLALLIELAGMIVFSKTPYLLIPWLMTLLILRRQSHEEDKIFLKEFGKAAQDYQKNVPAFIPRIAALKQYRGD